MKYVWIVSEGEYSDYQVIGVFSREEYADKYMKIYDEGIYNHVEKRKFKLDEMKKYIDENKSNYHIIMQENGDSMIRYVNYIEEKSDIYFNVNTLYRCIELCGKINAESSEKAIKILNEYRIQIKALRWPEYEEIKKSEYNRLSVQGWFEYLKSKKEN